MAGVKLSPSPLLIQIPINELSSLEQKALDKSKVRERVQDLLAERGECGVRAVSLLFPSNPHFTVKPEKASVAPALPPSPPRVQEYLKRLFPGFVNMRRNNNVLFTCRLQENTIFSP